jgi:hypothetical protein
MLYTLLTILTVFLLTVATSYMVLRCAVAEPHLRKFFLFLIVLTPPIAIFALLRVLLGRPKPIPYSDELGKIEDEIESERATIFGGKIMHPSLSQRWRMSYLYAIEKSAAAAVRFDPTLDRSFCGIANLPL